MFTFKYCILVFFILGWLQVMENMGSRDTGGGGPLCNTRCFSRPQRETPVNTRSMAKGNLAMELSHGRKSGLVVRQPARVGETQKVPWLISFQVHLCLSVHKLFQRLFQGDFTTLLPNNLHNNVHVQCTRCCVNSRCSRKIIWSEWTKSRWKLPSEAFCLSLAFLFSP